MDIVKIYKYIYNNLVLNKIIYACILSSVFFYSNLLVLFSFIKGSKISPTFINNICVPSTLLLSFWFFYDFFINLINCMMSFMGDNSNTDFYMIICGQFDRKINSNYSICLGIQQVGIELMLCLSVLCDKCKYYKNLHRTHL